MSEDDFLSRWSRRKHAAKSGVKEEVPEVAPAAAAASTPPPVTTVQEPDPPLPPVESLTPESDFTPFMRPGVDPGLRQQALRRLVRDPRFNVMDGLDTYIADFSLPDPIPPDWLGRLNQMAHLGDRWPEKAPEEEPAAAPQDGAAPENQVEEQQVASDNPAPQSDTSTSGSPPTQLKES